jgi:hypothetical protein
MRMRQTIFRDNSEEGKLASVESMKRDFVLS